MIHFYPGDADGNQREHYVLKNVRSHTYIVNEYEPAQSSLQAQIMQLITYNLRSYTDRQYHSQGGEIVALERGNEFAEAAAGMVRNALWIHDLAWHDDFEKFSSEIAEQAESLYRIGGFRLSQDVDQGVNRSTRRVELYHFQKMVYDLKRYMEREVFRFIDGRLPVIGAYADAYDLSDPEIGEDDSKLLEPLDITLDPMEEPLPGAADLKPYIPQEVLAPPKRLRGRRARQEAYNEQMLSLMAENNKLLANYASRFENVQEQIDAERSERLASTDMLREDFATLRELVTAALQGESAGRPSLDLDIIFDRNAHRLKDSHKAMLNSVILAMKEQQSLRATLIGHADRIGDPDFNAWISRQRAQAVEAYLLEQGIGKERLSISYLGDSQSLAANPADRRVEVKVR